MTRILAATLGLLALAPAVHGEGIEGFAAPIPWQDPSPLARPFLQLPFEAPATLPPGHVSVAIRTLYSSTIVRGVTPTLDVDIALESAQPILVVRWGVRRGLELHLEVPGAVDWAGFLNEPIKAVESVFSGVNPLRLGSSPKAARFRVKRPDGSGIDWRGVDGSVGDPWLEVKGELTHQDGLAPALAWRGALKVPAAPAPYGSGHLEVGTGVLAGWQLGRNAFSFAADLMIPGGPLPKVHLATRPHLSLQLGAARRFTPWFTALVQVSHDGAGIARVGLPQIDAPAHYLLAGVRLERRATALEFALVENILHSARGADISAVLAFSWRS